MSAANDFLMAAGVASAKFPTPGTTVSGTITREPEVQQQRDFTTGEPKFWDDGKPMQQLQVQLATTERDPAVADDDGVRAIYVKGQMLKAVREAVRKSGAPGLQVGGQLSVTYTGDGETTRRGMNPPKQYAASYVPAASAQANEFLANGEPEPAAPAAPAGLDPAALAALANLTPAQKAALGL